MKIATVLGTRPEIIRLSRVIPLIDQYATQVLINTGQNFDDRLNGLFFRELGVRDPDVHMGVRAATFAEQIGQIITRFEPILLEHRPDRLLVLGDTNSGLTAIVARRFGLPVYHMEAGNRCYDDRVPEEVNRRVIDHASTVLMPYTRRSRDNLIREGCKDDHIYVTGNPIRQVIEHHRHEIAASNVLSESQLVDRRFFLVTLHREENVDRSGRLQRLLDSLGTIHRKFQMPVICSLHPRTRARIESFEIDLKAIGARFVEPMGFFDFVRLEQSAFCVLTDSGTVQEEACIYGTPTVTLRDVTERPETIECGSNVLAGSDPEAIAHYVEQVTTSSTSWVPPPEYMAPLVAETVARIVLGYQVPDRAEEKWHELKAK